MLVYHIPLIYTRMLTGHMPVHIISQDWWNNITLPCNDVTSQWYLHSIGRFCFVIYIPQKWSNPCGSYCCFSLALHRPEQNGIAYLHWFSWLKTKLAINHHWVATITCTNNDLAWRFHMKCSGFSIVLYWLFYSLIYIWPNNYIILLVLECPLG